MKAIVGCIVALLCLCNVCVYAQGSLVGTHASQERENAKADAMKLDRIKDNKELEKLKQDNLLVPLRETKGLVIDRRLPEKFRFVRSWVREYLEKFAAQFHEKFAANLKINSAVRTIEYQKNLQETNANAAPTSGKRQSSHPTGATVDIAKLTLTKEQIIWMREQLLILQEKDEIHAVEEHYQAVFHIMVLTVTSKEKESARFQYVDF